MLLTLSGRSFIKIQYTSFPLFPVAYPFHIVTQLQYYVKCEKCKVNDVIFPSGCEAHAIFSFLPKDNFQFRATVILSFLSIFRVDQSKIVLFG